MKIENAVPYIGALVTGLDVKRMTNSEWQTLYQTWLDRHVLIVRGQELSKADFLAYSRRFGRLKPHVIMRTRDPDNPEITLMGVTSMAKDGDGAKLILNRGEGWHTDSHGTPRSARAPSSTASRFRATAATRCLPQCMWLTTRCPSA
jgi:alpha-ketoglutarate-dependent taurine dioxygenase